MMSLRMQLEVGLNQMGLVLGDDQIEALLAYVQLLQKWNAKFNLTRISKPEHIVTHHLLDCLTALPVLDAVFGERPQRILDVGSGAGLPGLVWAIAKPSWQFYLVDAVQKKVGFMQQVWAEISMRLGRKTSRSKQVPQKITNTETSVEQDFGHTGICVIAELSVIHARIESINLPKAPTLITSRAFSDLKQFVHLTQHLADEHTQWAALKGQLGEDCEAPLGFESVAHRLVVPNMPDTRHVLLVKHQQKKAGHH